MNYVLGDNILVSGSPDNGTAVYLNEEDLLRRIWYGWTLKEIVEHALEGEE